MRTHDTPAVLGRRPLLRRLGAGALLAGGASFPGGPVGAAAEAQANDDGTARSTISVNSPSGVTVEYGFELGIRVEQSTHAPPAVPHDAATVDPDDVVDGASAAGATAGGVDSYEYAVVVESAEVSDCDAANVWIDDERVDACDLEGATVVSRTLSVNSPSGVVVEYALEVASDVGTSTHVPPGLPHDEATVDPDDVVDGTSVAGATAGGVDSYEVAVGLSAFDGADCGRANVWIDDARVDACSLAGGSAPDAGGGEAGSDGSGDGRGDGGDDGEEDGGTDDGAPAATKLVPGDGAAEDQFGTAVALAGDRALVGAPFATGTDGVVVGAAYAFARGGGGWTQRRRLSPEGGARPCAFGTALALGGDAALVGAPFLPEGSGGEPGRAVVFGVRGWTPAATVTDDEEPLAPDFGGAVDLDGDTAVVGWYDPDFGDGLGHVLDRSGGAWSHAGHLRPEVYDPDDAFGRAVALDGDTALVGAPATGTPGRVVVFERTSGDWRLAGTIRAADAVDGDDFGAAVALDGDRAVVGAPAAATGGAETGAAFVFERTGSGWNQTGRLVADDAGAGAEVGRAVALDGATALVGAPGAAPGDGPPTGAAYAFAADGSDGQIATMAPDDGAAGDEFGSAVALDGGTVLVGAPLHAPDGREAAGAAYAFSDVA